MIRHAISRTGLARATWAAALAALAGTLGFAGPAAAATTKSTTTTSSNWSGYAAHGSSTTFKAVSGRWRIPSASCEKGEQSFSSFWVGIGGYNENSTGLEQDGTELDCNADGTQTVSAWYELLPAAPHTISLKVASGDLMSASVHIRGKAVTMTIKDLTTRQSFSKTVTDGDIDDTSVEWITEAPSDCSSDSDCDVLPLADFGSVRFSNASATTTTGVSSNIETGKWTTTKLLLGYKEDSADDFVADTDSGDATPSALTDDDSEFTVTWSGTETSSGSSGSGSSGSGSSGSSGSGSSGSGGAPNPGGGGYGGGGSGGGPGGGGPGGL